ncbi:MAG: metal-dependent hydrolase [Candidatus Diapherotrites archaeon]
MAELCFFGHSFFKLSLGSANILIDPFITTDSMAKHGMEKLIDCRVAKEQLKNINLILLTHEHFDHFDKASVEELASKNNACVIAHEGILNELNLSRGQLVPAKIGSTVNSRSVSVEVFPAHHPSSFYPVGYLVKGKGCTVFHAGDTALMDEFEQLKPDIALLPIGGGTTMDCVDAVKATKVMKPRVAIPMHYNTFDCIKADPQEFKARIEKSNLKTKAVILKPGQKYRL